MMRTTLNVDPDVQAELAALARERGRSVSRIANELMRAGLREVRDRPDLPPYVPPVFDTGPALVDVTDVAEALEVLDLAQ